MKDTEPKYDEIVEIPWGNRSTVRAKVREVYGHASRHVVVVRSRAELSDCVVSEDTTLSVPIGDVTRVVSRGLPTRWPLTGLSILAVLHHHVVTVYRYRVGLDAQAGVAEAASVGDVERPIVPRAAQNLAVAVHGEGSAFA